MQSGYLADGTTSTKSFLRPFKSFKKKDKDHENNILPRRPSLVITGSSEADLENGIDVNSTIKSPDVNLNSPNTHSFLQAPSFLKVYISQ